MSFSLSPLGTYKENGHYKIALKRGLTYLEVSIWNHRWVYSVILIYLILFFFLYIKDIYEFLWAWSLASEYVDSLHSQLLGILKNQENSFQKVTSLVFWVNVFCMVEDKQVLISVVAYFAPKVSSTLSSCTLSMSSRVE